MKAVPEKAQAKGSMYQGAMEIRYRLAAIETIEMATALQALTGLILNTCRSSAHPDQRLLVLPGCRQLPLGNMSMRTSLGSELITSPRVTSSGSSAPTVLYPVSSAI